MPPSVLDGDRRYRWSNEGLDCSPAQLPLPPDWLLKLLYDVANGGSVSSPRTDDSLPSNAIPAGQRNSALASIAGTMRRVGMSESEILAALHTANNDRCKPPLPAEEIDKIAWSVTRYEPDTIAVAVAENWAGQDREESQEAGLVDPGPFPSHLLNVSGFLADVMEYNLAGAFRRQPELALAGALCLLATLTGRKVMDESGTRTNIYCLGICRSGGGKERARQVNKEVLFRAGLDRLIGAEGIASSAGLVSALVAEPAQLMQLDEIGRLLQTIGNPAQSPHLYNIPTQLMKLYTCSNTLYKTDTRLELFDQQERRHRYRSHIAE